MLASLCLAAVQIVSVQAAVPLAEDAELAVRAERLIAETGSPGAVMMLADDGMVRIGTAGVRERGRDAAIAPDDLWHIGSDTKAMTATLVARLAERGTVSWDDTIGDRLGEAVPGMDPAYRDLTFRHLLSHRAGLVANPGMLALVGFATSDAPLGEQRLDYARGVLSREPAAVPEDEFLYSNAGYVVAGAMLEQATGQSWEALMQAEVFEPLGMTSAGFGAPGTADGLDQPRGHRGGLFGRLNSVTPGPRADNPPVMGPAGTVHVSMPDLARFLRAHLDEPEDFLSAQSWAQLHTPPFGGDYAMGWGVDADGRLQHAGSNTMWFVLVGVDPVAGRVMAIGVNDGRIDRVAAPVRAAMETLAEAGGQAGD